jgi:hypothetical protein
MNELHKFYRRNKAIDTLSIVGGYFFYERQKMQSNESILKKR